MRTPPQGVIPSLPALPGLPASTSRVGQPDLVAPKAGDLLDGRYLLEETIGEGGVGLVFRAVQVRLRRPVAVKLLQQTTLGEHALGPRFEREALTLAALSHPNIVRLQDYGMTRGVPYLIMELANGETLRQLLDREGALPVARALGITRQLLHALAHAHAHGVVHRDLKPANITVETLPHQPEHVKILDFGFAKLLPGFAPESAQQLTRPGFAFGSPSYISPEQCTGSPIDGRADLYSVGVLLFEMLTGAPPFTGEAPELLRQHLSAAIPTLAERRAELGPETGLQALIERALAKAREERFADAAALLRAIQDLRHDGELVAAPYVTPSALARGLASARSQLERHWPVLREHARVGSRASLAASRRAAVRVRVLWLEHGLPAMRHAWTFARAHGEKLAERVRTAWRTWPRD